MDLWDLKELLAIPTISAHPEQALAMGQAAEWLTDRLQAIGFPLAEKRVTPGHPLVYAERPGHPGAATLLMYGHYDVQPVDPVSEWDSDPFQPRVLGEYLYARGASDMKGQIWAFLRAVEAWIQAEELPIHLKILLDGEEESLSPSLPGFIAEHQALLACDFLLNCDAGILGQDAPAVTYALRGIAYFEIEIRGPEHDLHSGSFGGAVPNPGHILAGLIAGLHDASGRVTLPGFYDDVCELDEEERKSLSKASLKDEDWLRLAGVKGLTGEDGYSTTERIGARPSLDVCGILSGYTGPGVKTIIPGRALAKLCARLVPNQDPCRIRSQIETYLSRNAPDTVSWEVRELMRGPWAVTRRDSCSVKAAIRSLEATFHKAPVLQRMGFSVPAVGHLQSALGPEAIMMGFMLPDDHIHGPNERMHIPTLLRGAEAYARFLGELAGGERRQGG